VNRFCLSLAALSLIMLSVSCGDSLPPRPSMKKGLIVLGIDGMDPRLLRQYIGEGKMPTLAKLYEAGNFRELGTTNPPQSPVAWSTFLTGLGATGHGIYDFVHRDPHHLEPYLSTTKTEDVETIGIGSMAIPLSGGNVELLRQGDAFWQLLERAGIPATVVKVPANFPPAGSAMNESMSGMGTPDLLGTYGTFQAFTDDPAWVGKNVSGGVIHELERIDDQTLRTRLDGPPNPLSAEGELLTVDAEVLVDRDKPVALIRFGDSEVVLQPGEWSEWTRVGFDAGMLAPELGGIVRVYLKQLSPHIIIYISPINLDPLDPAMPLSGPESYVQSVAADIGRFYTQGMPEDTKALASGLLTDDEFLSQAELVWTERKALLERELSRFDGGLLFFYVSSIDQICHVFWRAIMKDAAPEDAKYAYVIPDLYQKVDTMIGEVIERAGPDTTVVIMSDHGFAPYKYKVHLNTWLANHDYLALLPPDEAKPGSLGHIDWENTQAYALGLNQLFINLEGREANGVVPESERELLIQRLSRELEAFRDPDSGLSVVTAVEVVDTTKFPDRAPDLLVGYNRGYRSSDESAIGMVSEKEIERNTNKWSGDHCMDPRHVPGVLLSTQPFGPKDSSLLDLTPTILDFFGVASPEGIEGQVLWQKAGEE
jgi:predicted AlkP superfamily phosphohydrolase/phosphomutase